MKAVLGTVISDKMMQTAVVSVERFMAHPLYQKRLRRTTKYHAHNDMGAKIGDRVEMVQIKPMSKTKFWKITKILGGKEQPIASVAAVVEAEIKPVTTEKTETKVKKATKATKK